MSEEKRIRIKISEVFSNLGTCKNPVIEFEKGSGYLQPCEGDEYIEIIPTGEIEGLAVWVKCEDCGTCGWKKIDLTPCDDDTDCKDCATCSPSGYCIYICNDDELCVNGKCADCDDEHPCENGKDCIDGKCKCPPEKPYWSGKECRACETDKECGNCFKCTKDGCVPKDCGKGACDPVTGDCVECMNSGDCKDKDPNACCNPITHKCECCEGYTKNFETGKCEKEPECYIDDDCKDPCKYCDHGECKPRKCPEGQTCYEGDCVTICDCNKGGCPDGYTCVPYGDICICVLCEGDCDTTDDCGNGCMCGNLKKCIPNPCQGSCEDGTDCGEGCGCNKKTKRCEPCSDKDCGSSNTCNDLDGCNCNGTSCEDSDSECSGTCDTFRDCAGENCTCIDGKCVSCDNFPCNDGVCDSVPGCKCAGGNDCVGSGKDCNDTFTFKENGCGAKIDLKLAEKCNCKSLILDSKLISTSSLPSGGGGGFPTSKPLPVKYTLELRKKVTGNPLLSDTTNEEVGNNELPISGVIEFGVKYWLKSYIGKDAGVVEQSPVKMDLVGKAKIDHEMTLLDIGSDYDENNHIVKVQLIVTVVDDIELANGCLYKKGKVLIEGICNDTFCELKSTKTSSVTIKSKTLVDPLLKIYRTKDDIFTTPFRKLYKTPVSTGKYTDKLYGAAKFTLGKQILVPDEGLLLGNQTYIAKNDCSCEKYASLGKVINCEPASLSYNLSECNSDIVLNGFTPQCSTNKDLSWYGLETADINYSQAYWKLFINGSEVGKFRFFGDPTTGEVRDVNTNQSISGWVYNTPNHEPIDTVELKMYYGDVMVCDSISEKIDNNIPIPTNANTCPSALSTNYYNMIDKTSNGLTVTSVSAQDANGNSVYVEDTGSKFKVHAPFGIKTTVRATYSTGCVATYEIEENCCGSFNASASANLTQPNCGGDLNLLGTATGGAGSITWKWTTPDGQILNGQNQTLSSYVSGTYRLDIRDENGCESSATVDVNVLDMDFQHPDSLSVCEGGNVDIPLTGTNGAVVEYRVGTNPTQTATLPATITVSNVVVSTVVTYNTISYGGCTNSINETTVLTVVDNATAQIDNANLDTQQCVGSTAPSVPVTGTPNVIVDYTINSNTGQIQLDSSGNGNIQLPNAAGSYAVHLTKATLGECVNNLDDLETILVQDSPVINIQSNSYECSSAGGGTFQYDMQFEVSNYTGTPTSDKGTVSNISGDLYKVAGIPSGQSATISASNGTCQTQQATQAYNCDCNAITVPPPVPTETPFTFCEGSAVPALEVTMGAGCTNCRVDWYDKAVGGTMVQGNSLTYTPPAPGADTIYSYFAEAVDLDSGCKSSRTEVWIEESALPDSDFSENSGNTYCQNSVVQFSIPYKAGVTHLWEVTNGTIQGSNSGTGVSVLLDSIAIVDVKLTATNQDGCETTTTKNYTVGELTFTIDAYDCGNDKAVLHLGGIVGHTYKATFINTTDSTTYVHTGLAGGSAHDIAGLTDGDYTVNIEDETGNGCVTSDAYSVNCCALTWGCSAVLVTEGCYTNANGSPFDMDVTYTTENYAGYHLYVEKYINGVKIGTESWLPEVPCSNVPSSIGSGDLNLFPNLLNQTNNVFSVIYKKNDANGDVIYTNANVLTFDANNC